MDKRLQTALDVAAITCWNDTCSYGCKGPKDCEVAKAGRYAAELIEEEEAADG